MEADADKTKASGPYAVRGLFSWYRVENTAAQNGKAA